MKRIFILSLLVIFGCTGLLFAAAVETTTATARTASVSASGIEQVVAVADGASGYTQNIDVRGSASVREYPKQIASSTGLTLNTGVALVTGACYVASISMSGITTAGDYVLIYDALSATGTPKFEISAGTAKDTTNIVIPGGAIFATGVFADSNANVVFCSIAYDN